MKPVIVCGSGPTLGDTDVYATGIPIACVSTAIRHLYRPKQDKRPDLWFSVDNIHGPHGPEGKEAMKDAAIKLIVPDNRRPMMTRMGAANVDYVFRRKCPPGKFMDDGPGLIRRQNRSMLFAIEYLCKLTAFDCLIFAGVDLRCDPKRPYVHDGGQKAGNRINSKDQQHRREFVHVKDWYPIAQAHGITWLVWSKSSPMNEYLESFDGNPASLEGYEVPAGQLPAVHADQRPG